MAEQQNHDFQKKHFHRPTFCAHCRGFIWGVFRAQGFRCTRCKAAVHKKCLQSALHTACPASASSASSSADAAAAPAQTMAPTVTEAAAAATAAAVPPAKKSEEESLFERYAGTNEVIGPDGVLRLFEDLCVAFDSVEALLFAFAARAKASGFFTRAEFAEGLRVLRAKSVDGLRAALGNDAATLGKDRARLHEIYAFAFDFAKESPEKKVLEAEYAAPMIALVLGGGKPGVRHVDRFVGFLREEKRVAAMNRDQWECFWQFATTIDEDMGNYDPVGGAWPVLFDDFFALERERRERR